MAGERLSASFRFVVSFGFCEKQSASKPPQDIHKPLCLWFFLFIKSVLKAIIIPSCDLEDILAFSGSLPSKI